MTTVEELKEECEKYVNLYWSLFNKTKDDCSYYKGIIHEQDLEIIKLKREMGIYKANVYTGKITSVSPDNVFGSIECSDFENKISFHKENCKDLRNSKVFEWRRDAVSISSSYGNGD